MAIDKALVTPLTDSTRLAKAFISYSHQDQRFVEHLKAGLQMLGIEVWDYHDRIKPGQSFVEEIVRGIKECDFFLAVISANSEKSDFLTSEIAIALSTKAEEGGSFVIPILIKPKGEIPIFLRSRQYLDFSDSEKFNENIVRLTEAMVSQTATQPNEINGRFYFDFIEAQRAELELESNLLLHLRRESSRKIAALVTTGISLLGLSLTAISLAGGTFSSAADGAKNSWHWVLSFTLGLVASQVVTFIKQQYFRGIHAGSNE